MRNAVEVCDQDESTLQSLDFTVNRFFMKLFRTSSTEIVTVSEKKEASSFSGISLAFLGRFSYFCINGNRNEYSMTTCNLLTY